MATGKSTGVFVLSILNISFSGLTVFLAVIMLILSNPINKLMHNDRLVKPGFNIESAVSSQSGKPDSVYRNSIRIARNFDKMFEEQIQLSQLFTENLLKISLVILFAAMIWLAGSILIFREKKFGWWIFLTGIICLVLGLFITMWPIMTSGLGFAFVYWLYPVFTLVILGTDAAFLGWLLKRAAKP